MWIEIIFVFVSCAFSYFIGTYVGFSAGLDWAYKKEGKPWQAMYKAAKGDLDDVLRSRDEVTNLLEEAQREIQEANIV